MRRLRVSMTTKHRLPSWLANRKRGFKSFPRTQSFRDSASFRRGQQSSTDRKRKWASRSRGAGTKYSKTYSGASRASDSNQSASNNSNWLSALSPFTLGQSNGKPAWNVFDKLEITHMRQMDPSSSDRVQNTLSQDSAPVAALTDDNQGGTAERTYAGVNSVSYLQGSNHSSGSSSSAIYLDAFPGGERSGNRGVSPCDQPKGPKRVPPQGEIQDGGTPHCSLPTPQQRLHDETRSEGRLLCCTVTSGLQEIPSLSVRRNNIRVPLPSVWSVAGPPGFYQDFASCCNQTALRGSANSHSFGRPAVDSSS